MNIFDKKFQPNEGGTGPGERVGLGIIPLTRTTHKKTTLGTHYPVRYILAYIKHIDIYKYRYSRTKGISRSTGI